MKGVKDEMGDLPVDFAHETFTYKLEEEGFNACNPFQVGFARIFCRSKGKDNSMERAEKLIAPISSCVVSVCIMIIYIYPY